MRRAVGRWPVLNAIALLCLAQTIAVWGEHVLLWNGLSLWAYDHLGGTHGIGIALFSVTLPALLSYPAGWLVSGLPPRLTLLASGIARLVLISTLALFAWAFRANRASAAGGSASLLTGVTVLGLAALVSLVDSFFMPVLKSALPLWAGNTLAQRGRANALLEATDAPGFVLGPPAAAFLYLWQGLTGLTLALSLSYGAALILLLYVPPPTSSAPVEEHDGAWIASEEPTLPKAFFLAISALSMLVVGLVQTIALPFICETLHLPESAFGVLTALMGLGITIGAGLWLLPAMLRLPVTMRLLLPLALSGVALLAGAEARSAAFCGAAWLVGGAGFAGITLTLTTVFQEEVTAAGRTRTLGLAHTLEAAGVLIGEAAAPVLASALGLRGALRSGGILLVLLALGGIFWLGLHRRAIGLSNRKSD